MIGYMRLLLDSPAEARRIGDNGRTYAAKRFSIERFAADWERLLAEVCGI